MMGKKKHQKIQQKVFWLKLGIEPEIKILGDISFCLKYR